MKEHAGGLVGTPATEYVRSVAPQSRWWLRARTGKDVGGSQQTFASFGIAAHKEGVAIFVEAHGTCASHTARYPPRRRSRRRKSFPPKRRHTRFARLCCHWRPGSLT